MCYRHGVMSRSFSVGLCLALTLISACASSSPQRAAQTLGDAIEAGQLRRAYELMSKDYRDRVAFREFEAQIEGEPSDARRLARTLQNADQGEELSAEVELADGTRLELVWEDDAWRLSDSPFNFYDQSSPRAALQSFVRAVSRRRYDVVIQLAPEAYAQGLTPELVEERMQAEDAQRLVTILDENLDAPIEVLGDRATLVHSAGRVLFVRENGVWKIEDPG